MQSDWHQKGKKHGYQEAGGTNLIDGQNYEFWNNRADSLFNMTTNPHLRSQISEADWPRLQADLAQARENRNRLSINAADVVPDAPFKETWPDLGLKQQVLETAADPSAQWIGFTGGADAGRALRPEQAASARSTTRAANLSAYDHAGMTK